MFRLSCKSILKRPLKLFTFPYRQRYIHRSDEEKEHREIEEFNTTLQKKFLLFRGALTKNRYIVLKFPIAGHIVHRFTLSELCGHGAFLFLAISYLENEFLNLRIYALSGTALSIIYQYYREKPLWIPIRWNTIFLLINSIMIILLLKEQSEAENISEEQKAVYEASFKMYGMKTVDFLHLMSIAERREVKEGEKLVTLGGKHHHLHFVHSGRLSVRRNSELMPEIRENQFVGAMSFLNWEGIQAAQQRVKQRRRAQFNQWNSDSFHVMDGVLDLDLIEPKQQQNISMTETAELTAKTISGSGDEAEGLADVQCKESCVVYSWGFRELRELLVTEPGLGLVFERCLSADLNKKMSTNWAIAGSHQREQDEKKYTQLLSWMLTERSSILNTNKERVEDLLSNEDNELLARVRKIYGVTTDEHEQAVQHINQSKGKRNQSSQDTFNQSPASVNQPSSSSQSNSSAAKTSTFNLFPYVFSSMTSSTVIDSKYSSSHIGSGSSTTSEREKSPVPLSSDSNNGSIINRKGDS